MSLVQFYLAKQMNLLIINTHLTYPGWSEGKLNLTFMDAAKTFFVERGHGVAETFVERGVSAQFLICSPPFGGRGSFP